MNLPTEDWMHIALNYARLAETLGEIPVGAVIVKDDQLISFGHNQKEATHDPTQHAEIIAIRAACQQLRRWRLSDCVMYVTLEPCIMCSGAIQQARIPTVFFGAHDAKCGACGSLYQVNNDLRLNHRFTVQPGILAEESQNLLKNFFLKRRHARHAGLPSIS